MEYPNNLEHFFNSNNDCKFVDQPVRFFRVDPRIEYELVKENLAKGVIFGKEIDTKEEFNFSGLKS